MNPFSSVIGLCLLALFSFCSSESDSGSAHHVEIGERKTVRSVGKTAEQEKRQIDKKKTQKKKAKRPIVVRIEKDLLYDKHTLPDRYKYGKTPREFQWEKIRECLKFLESVQHERHSWGILRNYKNLNGEAPTVKSIHRNEYGRVSDSLGVERYQGIPLYEISDTLKPVLYGRDGNYVRVLGKYKESSGFLHVETVYPEMKKWLVPYRYIKTIGDTVRFDKAIFVDRHNQNIATLEKTVDRWLVRSMNPATTGRFRPPYAQPTPLGLFALQEKKSKMVYLKDGSAETGGFAPYANRFTSGAYIHGVPVPAPGTEIIEFSYSLGTTPQSHMCVRNATSHSKFIYNWGSINKTVVFVLE